MACVYICECARVCYYVCVCVSVRVTAWTGSVCLSVPVCFCVELDFGLVRDKVKIRCIGQLRMREQLLERLTK